MPRQFAHFTYDELACHDGTPYPYEWRDDRLIILITAVEGLRTYLGDRPLTVGSAYRTPTWNRKCGGATSSQHVLGRALDLHRPRGLSRRRMHILAREYAQRDERVGGLGLYVWGIHLDIRARRAGRLVVWNRVPARTFIHDTRPLAA